MELKLHRITNTHQKLLLLIVLHGIETDLPKLLLFFIVLLIVLHGIETERSERMKKIKICF